MKQFTSYEFIEERPAPEEIMCDQIIRLDSYGGRRDCPYPLRRIVYRDPDTGKILVFLTNHLSFGPLTIARIYKDRWQIELFFKALKQNLRIKSFVGTTPNALHTQIWTALIAMVLLKYLKLRAQPGWALSNLVAFLRWNLFTSRDLWEWLNDPYETPPWQPASRQLILGLPGFGQLKGGPES